MIFAIALVLVSALVASAADFNVTVGANNQLAFNPTSVTVQNGDTVHFEFVSKNHSIVQSTFASPCTRADNGIDSGFQNITDPNVHAVWSFKVNNASSPFWFYCAQKNPVNHCQMGMVFAVNPTAEKSFEAFQAAAKGNANSTAGGTSSPIPSSSGISSGTSSSAGSGSGVPSGAGFSTNVAPTPSSAAASVNPNQSSNSARFTRDLSSTGVATVAGLIATLVAFVF